MLEGKVIIITGAGSGIGQATSVLCAASGAQVVAGDVNEAGLQETLALVREAGGVAEGVVGDVGNEADVIALVSAAKEHFGRLDGAFNNAGLLMRNKLLQDLTLEDWDRVASVNTTGVFLCMKHQIALMSQSGGGVIVNTSSVNGVVGVTNSTEYIASKHAVIGLTRAASTEAGVTGVRVNAVLPGMIATPMVAAVLVSDEFRPYYDSTLARHSIGRFGKPEDVAYVVRFLLSDQSAFMNGAAVAVDGGYTAC